MSAPYYSDESVTLFHGDSLAVLREMPDRSVDCCVTSPPYFGLRDYGEEGQYGLETSPAEYVETMRALFSEVRRVLADDGTLWLNIGDSYNSGGTGYSQGGSGVSAVVGSTKRNVQGRVGTATLPAKNLMGIPWRTVFALQDDGWILRNDIIWAKPNAMPESVTDRLSTRHEHLFMLSKSPRYWFNLDPIREPLAYPNFGNVGRNPGDVWTVNTQPFSETHFAVMPKELARRATLAGCKPGGVVLDPFSGSGTTGMVAGQAGRRYVGIDLSRDYLDLSLRTRLAQTSILDFGSEASA